MFGLIKRVRWNKLDRIKQIPNNFSYMWNLKKLHKQNRFIDTENKLGGHQRGGRRAGGVRQNRWRELRGTNLWNK